MDKEILAHHSDCIVPFILEGSGLRGRLVRLSSTLAEILGKHDYPAAVSEQLAEAATLAAVFGSLLKDDGIFSLQAKGDGAVRLLVADYSAGGALRAYAAVDTEKLAEISAPNFESLLGDGYLSFTIDRDSDVGRYQGIVDITGRSLTAAAEYYFLQSDQIRTLLKFFIVPDGKSYHTAALCLQAMPPKDLARAHDLDVLPPGWEAAAALAATLTGVEALDTASHPHDVLYRLFHEGGVRVGETIYITHRCRCSYERAQRALLTLNSTEADELAENHTLEVRCEFCNTAYRFTLNELAALRQNA